MTAPRWHVAFCAPHGEKNVIREVNDLGYETFAPKEKIRRWRRRRRQVFERPLFPRYVFVKFSAANDQWGRISAAKDVVEILSNDGKPVPVPEGFTEQLQQLQSSGIFDASNPTFPIGTAVQIDSNGPFADFCGKVTRLRTGERVEVMLDYLFGKKRVNIPIARLNKLG
jgi:transcriptional antiterminator RfaH